jgi:hypothetical protein
MKNLVLYRLLIIICSSVITFLENSEKYKGHLIISYNLKNNKPEHVCQEMTDVRVDAIGSTSDCVRDISLHYRVQTDSRNYPCSWLINAGGLFPRE